MSQPTNEQLNRAMAEACGWRYDNTTYTREVWYSPTSTEVWDCGFDYPDYCSDRNTLSELWTAVGLCFKSYIRELTLLSCGVLAEGYADRDPYSWWEDTVPMPPRLHVEAALKALKKWPAEWEDR